MPTHHLDSLESNGEIKEHESQHASMCSWSLFTPLHVGSDPVNQVHGAVIKGLRGPGVRLGVWKESPSRSVWWSRTNILDRFVRCEMSMHWPASWQRMQRWRELRNKPFYHPAEEADTMNVYVGLTIASTGQQLQVCRAISPPWGETDEVALL